MDFIVVCCLQVLFLGSGQLNSFSPKPINSHRHATKIVIFALLSTRTIMVNKFEEIAGAPSAFPCINNHPKIHHEVFVYGGSSSQCVGITKCSWLSAIDATRTSSIKQRQPASITVSLCNLSHANVYINFDLGTLLWAFSCSKVEKENSHNLIHVSNHSHNLQ